MQQEIVNLVDDDDDVRESLEFLFKSVGLNVKSYSNASDFLEEFDNNQPGCIVTDVRMPYMSGLQLQQKLNEKGSHHPIIIMTGHADVEMAIQAMKNGAFDFVEKPINNQKMLDIVHLSLEKDKQNRANQIETAQIKKAYSSLSQREQDVMFYVSKGMKNKVIAAELNIALSTVDAHRAKVMEKMEADSVTDLLRMSLLLKLI